jgi:hypothetical protein
MEEIYSINLTSIEIAFIRQALDTVTINGKDAKFLANLQTKIEDEMMKIENSKITQKPTGKK